MTLVNDHTAFRRKPATYDDRLADLASFDRFHAPANLLRRYASGRVRAFATRIVAAIVGVVIIASIASAWLAFWIACVTFAFELLEWLVLRRLLARDRFDRPETEGLIGFVSFVQAIGVALPILVTGIHSDTLRFLAWTYLLGALVNTMLSARYHRPSHVIRVTVLCITAVSVLGAGALMGQISRGTLLTEAISLLAMSYMISQVFQHLKRRENRMIAAERDLIVQAEDARRLALVAEHALDSVMVMDPMSRITWVNPRFVEVTGYTAKEVIGRRPGEFLNHPDTDKAALARLAELPFKGEPVEAMLLNRRKDGKAIWMDVSQTPVFCPDGKLRMIISVERESTEAMRQKTRLREALAAAEAAAKEKAAFLGRMSHELRTPANGIVGGVELLRATWLERDQSVAVNILEESATRMTRLIEDILNYSELSNGKVRLCIERVDVGALLGELIETYRPAARAKKLDLVLQLPDSPLLLRADAALLRRMVDKILGNAVKFTETGGVDLSADYREGNLILRVRDSGPGVAQKDLHRVFERFEQADGRQTRAQDGIGLGLTMARDIARLMGGEISARSEPGEGSDFSMRIPAERVREAASGLTLPSKLHLLVAEDNKVNRLLFEKMLKGEEKRIDFAIDGIEAVEKYHRAPPDIVLMDLSMPGKDGISAARDIRQMELDRALPRCPILAVTANASDTDRQRCFEAGMDGFLAKPVRKARLMEAMEQALAG